jgi:hypothetical protein
VAPADELRDRALLVEGGDHDRQLRPICVAIREEQLRNDLAALDVTTLRVLSSGWTNARVCPDD